MQVQLLVVMVNQAHFNPQTVTLVCHFQVPNSGVQVVNGAARSREVGGPHALVIGKTNDQNVVRIAHVAVVIHSLWQAGAPDCQHFFVTSSQAVPTRGIAVIIVFVPRRRALKARKDKRKSIHDYRIICGR